MGCHGARIIAKSVPLLEYFGIHSEGRNHCRSTMQMRSEKHGALKEDEIALKVSTLAESFYLANLKDQVQFVIIENILPL